MTEDQAASELLKKWGVSEEESSPEPESSDEPEEPEAPEATTEPEEEAQETEPETGEDEFDVAGEKFKVPKQFSELAGRMVAKAKEVEAGATRKFQEAADLRKAVETNAEIMGRKIEIGKAQVDLLADLRFVQRRLTQFQNINVQQLGMEDPAALTRLNAEFNQLSQAERNILGSLQRVEHDLEQTTKQASEQKSAALLEFASKNIKGWGEETNKRLDQYLQTRGISRDTALEMLNKDERLLLVLEDAAYGARVRNASPQKKTDPQKTLKPGAAAAKTSSVAKADQALQRVRKTGRIEDAAIALLTRSNIRKR